MKNEKILDLIIWLFIFAAGLLAAYICFGVLNSSASGKFEQYSLGGAIAGALVSWSMLTSLYLQLRRSGDDLRELRRKNEELQHKVIRGAPCPPGFETEVDERQRIVLARPKTWRPKGGVIYDLELPEECMDKNDSFASSFKCFFQPLIKSLTPSIKQFYDQQIDDLKKESSYVHSYSHELVQFGGELSGVSCLKIIVYQFVKITIKRLKEPGKIDRDWYLISNDEALCYIYDITPDQLYVDQPCDLTLKGLYFRKEAKVYVNDQERTCKVISDNTAIVNLIEEDVKDHGILRINLENIEPGGKKSNTFNIVVNKKPVPGSSDDSFLTRKEDSDEEITSKSSSKIDPIGDNTNENIADLTLIQEIIRMRVICYHEPLEKIFYFDFYDDIHDFNESSATFNKILMSIRFLD